MIRRGIARRLDHDVHRWDNRSPQGRVVALERHVRGIDGLGAATRASRDPRQGPDGGPAWFAVSPLMHAAGMWTAFAAIMQGSTVVLYDGRGKLDARAVWETAERERVGRMTMVGDAYAGPLVAELQRGSYELSSLNFDRYGRGRHQSEVQARADGKAAASHHRRRLRLVGVREHGFREQSARHAERDLPPP